MGWEKRRGQLYYYHAYRVPGGGVKKTYVGRGLAAMAFLLGSGCATPRGGRRAREAANPQLEALDAETRELGRGCRLVLSIYLAAWGYHRHNYGPWRKRREKKLQTEDALG